MAEESRKIVLRKVHDSPSLDDASVSKTPTTLSTLIRRRQSSRSPSICNIGTVVLALEESGQMYVDFGLAVA